MNLHDKSFSGESGEYRKARNELLQAEIELRRNTEKIAELRRKLPLGGKLKEDYVFEEMSGNDGKIKETKFSDLFEPGKNTLIIYSYMYGPNAKSPCPMCTSIMDGINGMVFHVNQRVNFAVITKSPIQRITTWAKARDWNNLHFLSSFKNSYNTDYFAEDSDGNQLPMLNVFQKRPDGIFHFYGSELLYAAPEDGQDARHVDIIWPLWNLFDMTPEGRGTVWYPKLKY